VAVADLGAAVTRVVRNPKTGMLETAPSSGPTQHDLERLRRETRARIDGTEQFHVDQFAAPTPAPVAEPEFPPQYLCTCIVAYLGYVCENCRNA
jgi:hypothetical protein